MSGNKQYSVEVSIGRRCAEQTGKRACPMEPPHKFGVKLSGSVCLCWFLSHNSSICPLRALSQDSHRWSFWFVGMFSQGPLSNIQDTPAHSQCSMAHDSLGQDKNVKGTTQHTSCYMSNVPCQSNCCPKLETTSL